MFFVGLVNRGNSVTKCRMAKDVGRIGDPVACGSSVAQGHSLFDITE
jgi:hypothetical protein